jgi:hypothetical protein
VRLEDCVVVVVVVVRGGGHCEASASLELDEVEVRDLESAVLARICARDYAIQDMEGLWSPNNFYCTGLEKQNDFYIQSLRTLRCKGSVQCNAATYNGNIT